MITPFPGEEWGDDLPPTIEEANQDLQDLVEKGLLDYTIDEDGEFNFFLTEVGLEVGLNSQEDQRRNQEAQQQLSGRTNVYEFLAQLNEIHARRQDVGEQTPNEETWTRFEEQAESTFWRLAGEEN